MNKKKILFVDDEQDILRVVTVTLEKYGYEILTAVDGKEGLERAANDKPDVILLDKAMPIMDGREMLQRLRSAPDLKDIPVIMLTARCDPQDITAVRPYNVSSYVTKPFDPTDLSNRIKDALAEHKTAKQHSSMATADMISKSAQGKGVLINGKNS